MFNKDDRYNNPLDWWRIYVDKYPNIWKLASCILAIPATSAPSERIFSAAANIINKKSVCLKPETLDLLIFLRGNKDFVQWDKVIEGSWQILQDLLNTCLSRGIL